MTRARSLRRLTRADVIKAFSTPKLTHAKTMEIVAQYMGDQNVPPTWSPVGVRGTLGTRIARLWSRRLRRRHSGSNVYVQTSYDFGLSPKEMQQSGALAPLSAAVKTVGRKSLPEGMIFVHDELHRI